MPAAATIKTRPLFPFSNAGSDFEEEEGEEEEEEEEESREICMSISATLRSYTEK